MYSYDEVMTFVEEEDVKFIRLAFCDIHGRQKNISIMPSELKRAFTYGVSFDASAVAGFGDVVRSDLFLHPDPSTLSVLPWRPSNGRVVRMFCDIKYPDGRRFEKDGRYILMQAAQKAKQAGISCFFGAEFEFYLFNLDDNGEPTDTPFDKAGYMDIAPDDKGENVRREICFNLLEMGISPESSHHEEGPGQNEIDFRYSTPLNAADNAVTFKSVVQTIARRNGLFADFSPKPLMHESGNGLHINVSVKAESGEDVTESFMAGVLEHTVEMTAFFNPVAASYKRLGEKKAPKYVTWSHENRSQLIRIPAVKSESHRRMELRSPDPAANPYIVYALIIYAGLDGIKRNLKPAAPCNCNLFPADSAVTDSLTNLPDTIEKARNIAKNSEFIKRVLPEGYAESI